jgi:hypothetical protein
MVDEQTREVEVTQIAVTSGSSFTLWLYIRRSYKDRLRQNILIFK